MKLVNINGDIVIMLFINMKRQKQSPNLTVLRYQKKQSHRHQHKKSKVEAYFLQHV